MKRFAYLCSHESYQPEALVDQAVLAETVGFDMILGSDHFHPWVDDESAAGFVWSWLGALAARTERAAAVVAGRPGTVVATRWAVLAREGEEAWKALASMRGLRAPGRLEAVDPMDLRVRADAMDRSEILGKYTVVSDVEDLVEVYRPLVEDIGADYVAIQVASLDPMSILKQLGTMVLPRLREIASTCTGDSLSGAGMSLRR